ncbi:hypothetical protein AVDCRST_MAG94-1797 [uncultured Leptolyngbya sp.]|uniref:Uncharacterized protein n=1 Tax=uncultured Leptolyngbya sp. TaxID=332963 RepID=A0A6J4LBI0_9CYAN|nr:hypothetical protein AVDCRST_MAG94-1797 [uncultured Leptolyngbya sp.]
MQIENKVQEIATTTALAAAQDFLSTLPPEASQAVCPNFLSSLSEDVQADLQAVIHSRLQWSLQALKAELDEQQRQAQRRKAAPSPAMTPAPQPVMLPQAELRDNASASIEVPAKPVPSAEPQPLPVPVVQPRRQHVLVPKSTSRHQAEAFSTSPPLAAPKLNDVPSSQLELPITDEPTSLKPYQRRRDKEPQLTREEIFKPHIISPTDFASRPAEAVRRRRRTSIASS